MTSTVVIITPFKLLLALIFIFMAQGVSLFYKLGLFKDIMVGTIRTFGQLFLMGYALTVVFKLNIVYVSIGIFFLMISTAVQTIRGRVKERSVAFVIPTFISMLLSYFVVSVLVTGVIVGVDPWWKPQYFIPLSGMIVGNSMTAISISLDRLFSELKTRRREVEMKLSLGADFKEASQEILQNAIRSGMMPTINSMMGVGLVFIPGMMTGQILSGTDPLIAIRYQILVMLMLTAATALGAMLVLTIIRGRCFGKNHSLVLPPS